MPIIKLPGFGLPIDQDLEVEGFVWDWDKNHRAGDTGAVFHWTASNVTVRERSMMQMMDKISDTPTWRSQVFDEVLVQRWKTEMPDDFSDKMFEYVCTTCSQ